MELKTILSALELNCWRRHNSGKGIVATERGLRQYRAFRARILRLDAEKDKEIEQWEMYHGFHMGNVQMIETIAEKDEDLEMEKMRYDLEVAENMALLQQLVEKDARIAELEAMIGGVEQITGAVLSKAYLGLPDNISPSASVVGDT